MPDVDVTAEQKQRLRAARDKTSQALDEYFMADDAADSDADAEKAAVQKAAASKLARSDAAGAVIAARGEESTILAEIFGT